MLACNRDFMSKINSTTAKRGADSLRRFVRQIQRGDTLCWLHINECHRGKFEHVSKSGHFIVRPYGREGVGRCVRVPWREVVKAERWGDKIPGDYKSFQMLEMILANDQAEAGGGK